MVSMTFTTVNAWDSYKLMSTLRPDPLEQNINPLIYYGWPALKYKLCNPRLLGVFAPLWNLLRKSKESCLLKRIFSFHCLFLSFLKTSFSLLTRTDIVQPQIVYQRKFKINILYENTSIFLNKDFNL